MGSATTGSAPGGRTSRRAFLGAAGKATGLLLAPALLSGGCSPPNLGGYPFTLGVASGDPLPDGVLLWTRLISDAPDAWEMPRQGIPVSWKVAHDEGFRRIARRGTVTAEPAFAHSVHAEVDGLEPERTYYYRFEAGGEVSATGRTKTAPSPGSEDSELHFAFASCQAWRGGRFPAYNAMAREELDFVVHLGDYIYEEDDTRTLDDFRRLHAQYKGSAALRNAHARFPFVCVLDDHEVDNDWADAVSKRDESREEFLKVRAAAFQAYYEHMPLRPSAMPRDAEMALYRRLQFGGLLALNVLDTRQYRTGQADGRLIAPRDPASLDPDRTMTGSAQERWLFDGLAGSRQRWNVIAQQTMMAEYAYGSGAGELINHDQWDGYVAARDRLLGSIEKLGPSNPVVVSGDWHAGFVNDLKADFDDPRSATLATEFVGTSISSSCPWADRVRVALPENPHVKFFDGSHRGYTLCAVDRDVWRTDFRAAGDVGRADTLASWVVESGRPGAESA